MIRVCALWLVIILGTWHLVPSQAARTFIDGTYLEASSAIVTAPPFTMCAWVRPSATGVFAAIMAVGVSGSNDQRHGLNINFGNTVSANTRTTSDANSTSAGQVSLNTWAHVCGVWASSTSRQVYLNGTAATADTTNLAPTGLNRTWIARLTGFSVNNELNGDGGEFSIWNVSLTGSEIASLANKVSATRIRRLNLVSYVKVSGDQSPEPDWAASRVWTLTGTPAKSATHPPIGLFIRN